MTTPTKTIWLNTASTTSKSQRHALVSAALACWIQTLSAQLRALPSHYPDPVTLTPWHESEKLSHERCRPAAVHPRTAQTDPPGQRPSLAAESRA